MAISHKNIPDSEVHDPKGFGSAANNTVAKKNSSGSLEWGTVDTDDITDSSVTNAKVTNGTLGAEKFQTGDTEEDWVTNRIHSKQNVPVSSGSKITLYDDSSGYSTDASSAEKTDKFWVSQVDGTVSYSFDTNSTAARVSIWRNGVNIITEDGLGTFTGTFLVDFADVIYFTLHETSGGNPTVTLSNVLITADY